MRQNVTYLTKNMSLCQITDNKLIIHLYYIIDLFEF